MGQKMGQMSGLAAEIVIISQGISVLLFSLMKKKLFKSIGLVFLSGLRVSEDS